MQDHDAEFHGADADPTWAETNFFGFYNAEERLNVGVYALFRPNLGVVSSTICMNSQRAVTPWEADFCDMRAAMPIPEPRSLLDYQLLNSLHVRCLEPNRLWHIAYEFDCADGQLARVTGQSSPAGARVDILSDVAVQIALVAAVSAVGVRYHAAPTWFVAAFAGCWMINLVTSVLATGDKAQSLVASQSPVIRLVKLSRDYGAMITLLGLAIALVPGWLIWIMVGFTALNALFLLASIAAAARAALRPQP